VVVRRSYAGQLREFAERLGRTEDEKGLDSRTRAKKKAYWAGELARLQARQARYTRQGKWSAFNREPSLTFVLNPRHAAWEIMAVFVAAVLAYPCPLKRRFLGALTGAVVLWALNVCRLAYLVYAGASVAGADAIKVGLSWFWQSQFTLAAIVLWLLWRHLAVRRAHR